MRLGGELGPEASAVAADVSRPRPGLVWYNGSKAAVKVISMCMAAAAPEPR